MTKPADWPRYMTAKTMPGGAVRYYWAPRPADRQRGCRLEPEALGSEYGPACARAREMNAALDDWRDGIERVLGDTGTVRWMLRVYQASLAWEKLRPRSRRDYLRHMRIVEEMPLARPAGTRRTVGDLMLETITPRAADRLYVRLVDPPPEAERLRPGRVRQAHFEIDVVKKAWRVVQRLHPDLFPKGNPFEGIVRRPRGTQTKVPAAAAEAYALADALRAAGHPHLGAAALICFEWLQRPENVLDGATTWTDYRPGERVRIRHWKTGAMHWLDLVDDEGPLYPELEAYLATLPRLGAPIVLFEDPAGTPRPYKHRHAHAVVARIRGKAGLADHLTLASCRHGGLTEGGDAQLTEAEGMALSQHSSAAAFRLYVKRTEHQARRAARKRRVWRERG